MTFVGVGAIGFMIADKSTLALSLSLCPCPPTRDHRVTTAHTHVSLCNAPRIPKSKGEQPALDSIQEDLQFPTPMDSTPNPKFPKKDGLIASRSRPSIKAANATIHNKAPNGSPDPRLARASAKAHTQAVVRRVSK